MEPQSATQLLEQRRLVLVQRHTELLELVAELSSVTDELDTIRLMLGVSYANDQVSTPVVENEVEEVVEVVGDDFVAIEEVIEEVVEVEEEEVVEEVQEVVITPTEEVTPTPYVAQRMIPRPTGRFRY